MFRKLCRLLWVDISANEALGRKCDIDEQQDRVSAIPTKCNELVFDHAVRRFDAAEKRQDAIREKGKNLLPLLAIVGSLVTLSVGFFGHGYGLLLPIAFALATIFLHQEVLALGWSAFPRLEEPVLSADEGEQRARLTADYLTAARFIDARTDYMTCVLTAARRSTGLTLVSIVGVAAFYVVNGRPHDDETLIRAIRSNHELARELRGPRGDVGPQGPAGRDGPKGDPGRDFAQKLKKIGGRSSEGKHKR